MVEIPVDLHDLVTKATTASFGEAIDLASEDVRRCTTWPPETLSDDAAGEEANLIHDLTARVARGSKLARSRKVAARYVHITKGGRRLPSVGGGLFSLWPPEDIGGGWRRARGPRERGDRLTGYRVGMVEIGRIPLGAWGAAQVVKPRQSLTLLPRGTSPIARATGIGEAVPDRNRASIPAALEGVAFCERFWYNGHVLDHSGWMGKVAVEAAR